MADKQTTLEIIFAGVDKTGNAISSVGSGIDKINTAVQDVAQPLAGLADDVLKAEAAIAALGATIGVLAFSQAVKAEAALTDLQKVLGDGEGAAVDYTGQIQELALTFGVASSNVTASIASFKQAGFGIQESLKLTEASLTAVKIAELDADTASNLLIATLKGFQAPGTEVGRVLDVINETSNKFATNAGELAIGLAELSPVARAAGLSIEETAAVLTPVIEVFRSGGESSVAFKTILGTLTAPTKKQAAALKELGIETTNANGSLRAAGEILLEIFQKSSTLTKEQRNQLAVTIAGKEQFARFNAVLSNTAQFEAVLATATNATGSSQKELAVRLATTQTAIERFQTALGLTGESLGNEFIAPTKDSIDALTELLGAFKGVIDSGGLDPLFAALNPKIQQFTKDVQQIAKLLPDAFSGVSFDKLLASFDKLADQIQTLFTDVFGAVDLTTAEGVQTALQRIVDGVAALTNVTTGVLDGLRPIFQGIGAIIDEIGSSDAAAQQAIGNILGLAKSLTIVGPVIEAAASAIQSLGAGLGLLAGAQVVKAIAGIDGIGSAAAALGPRLSGLIGLLTGPSGLVVAAGAAGAGLGAVASDLVDKLVNANTETEQSLGTLIYELINGQDELERFSQAARETVPPLEDFDKSLRDIQVSIAETSGGTKGGARSQVEYYDALERVTTLLAESGKQFDATNGEVTSLKKTTEEAAQAQEKWSITVEEGVRTFSQASVALDDKAAATDKATAADKKAAEESKKSAEAIQQQANRLEEFAIQREKLASDERLKVLELSVDLNLAQLETQSKQAEAIIGGIGDTISSTGDTLSSLFGQLADAEGLDALKIERQLDREDKRRQEALDEQKRLNDSIIELNRARIDVLREQGEIALTIEGTDVNNALQTLGIAVLEQLQRLGVAEGLQALVAPQV